MNFREGDGLPISPQPVWQAVPESCLSVINVPVSRGPGGFGCRDRWIWFLSWAQHLAGGWLVGEGRSRTSPTPSWRGHQAVYPSPTNSAHQKRLITTDFPRTMSRDAVTTASLGDRVGTLEHICHPLCKPREKIREQLKLTQTFPFFSVPSDLLSLNSCLTKVL